MSRAGEPAWAEAPASWAEAPASWAEAPAIDDVLRLDFEVDVSSTLGPLQHGPRDPTIRFEPGVVWWATRTSGQAATLRIARAAAGWRVTAWGPGAGAAVAALPRLLGSEDDPAALRLPAGPLRQLAGRLRGLRFGRSDAVMTSLVPAIIEQKVTGAEAQRAYRRLVMRYGVPAPGPGGLRLPPTPERLASISSFDLHPLGLEQRRALTLIRAARRATWLERATQLGPEAAMARLRSIPGVGAWTAAETARCAFGDADAVSLGDFHTPHLVCWVLAGQARGDDRRRLELLEPFRGQRARLIRILQSSGLSPPRFGPRRRGRAIERL